MTPGLQINHSRDLPIVHFIILGVVAALLCTAGYFGYAWYTKGDLPPLVPVPASAKADTSVDEFVVSQSQVTAYSVSSSQPRYLSIPSLNIQNVRIQQVGLTKLNTLDMPKNINDTAWFTKSTQPGSGSGAVVIDGHSSGVTKDGVFAKLNSLKKDDEIIIERGDGKKITYTVQENNTMSLQEANTTGMQDMMKSLDPTKEGLTLISSAGNWVPRDKVFDKRIMIRAVSDL